MVDLGIELPAGPVEQAVDLLIVKVGGLVDLLAELEHLLGREVVEVLYELAGAIAEREAVVLRVMGYGGEGVDTITILVDEELHLALFPVEEVEDESDEKGCQCHCEG